MMIFLNLFNYFFYFINSAKRLNHFPPPKKLFHRLSRPYTQVIPKNYPHIHRTILYFVSERTFSTIYMIRYFHYPQLIHKQNCHLNSLNPYPPKQRTPFSCNHPRHPHSRVKLFSLSHIRLTKTENVDKWLSIHIFLF